MSDIIVKMDFTYGIITYNQEDFIIELLESIKYQIETFALKDTCNYLIVADDNSTDNTILYINTWIKENKKLFKGFKLLKSKVNSGVVSNFTNLMRNIKTDDFKVIAGDDIFSSNNIYKIAKETDDNKMNIYSTIRFNNNKTYAIDNDYINMFYYMNYKHTNKKDEFLIESIKPFNSPENFIKRHYYTEDCLSFISNFRMFEDDPSYLYFFRNNKQLTLNYIFEPFVLYRIHDKSLSNGGTDTTGRFMFLDDLHKYKKYVLKTNKTLKGLIYGLFAVNFTFLMKHRFSTDKTIHYKWSTSIRNHNKNACLNNPNFDSFKQEYDKMIKHEQVHLNRIQKNAKTFKDNYLGDIR